MITTIYIDVDYLIDQAFWKYSGILADRHHTRDFIATQFPETARIFTIQPGLSNFLTDCLEELVKVTVSANLIDKFFRIQADLAAVLDVLSPHLYPSAGPGPIPTQSTTRSPSLPRRRRFRPVRCEAASMLASLEADLTTRWTLAKLAERVHLSPAQAHRVFVNAYGKTPLAYQAMMRGREMARLLRETNMSVEAVARTVGWHDRSHAAMMFRKYSGINPHRYRRLLDGLGD